MLNEGLVQRWGFEILKSTGLEDFQESLTKIHFESNTNVSLMWSWLLKLKTDKKNPLKPWEKWLKPSRGISTLIGRLISPAAHKYPLRGVAMCGFSFLSCSQSKGGQSFRMLEIGSTERVVCEVYHAPWRVGEWKLKLLLSHGISYALPICI